jgi:L-alanine-DL-glutamate epimerase-like enolase superfamily enzyme
MPKIVQVRPVLLSSPYAQPDNLEVQICLKSGLKTCSLVEITLEDGTTGLGEGYLGVFAPHVFVEIVKLVGSYLIGREALDTRAFYNEICNITGYWSFQGAARHVVSACEIALIDAKAKYLGVPAYSLFGGATTSSIKLYGSGGDSSTPGGMYQEMEMLSSLGIDLFKIRARQFEVAKTVWVLERAGKLGISVGVDMAQNLAIPAQTVSEVVYFVEQVHAQTPARISFLEEVLGPMDIESYHLLRQKLNIKICGGEIVTTAAELCERVRQRLYDFVQPDATVIGGIEQTLEVFDTCRQYGSIAVVHAWGGAVCLMANYHAAFAGGGLLAEWPMPRFELREALLVEPLQIKEGRLQIPVQPGLGVQLTPQLEKFYSFREEAVYSFRPEPGKFPPASIWLE